VREFVESEDDALLKGLSEEWSATGWLLQRQTLLRGRFCGRPQQFIDYVVLVAEREPRAPHDIGAAEPSGARVEGFVCVGLQQVFLREVSLRAGFVFDLKVRPGSRFTSTGMLLLEEAERRCRQRGVAMLYGTVAEARSERTRKYQRLLRKMEYGAVAECTLCHWLLNKSALAPDADGVLRGVKGLPRQLQQGVQLFRSSGSKAAAELKRLWV
jgi:GNAT superfamily N-acetyltransferase